jgi:hypothetical protein
MANPSDIKIVCLTGMYGTCKTIKAYRGHDEIGDAYFCAGEAGGPIWYIGACGRETTLPVEASEVDGCLRIVGTNDEMLARVEAVLVRLIAEASADAEAA